MDDLVKFVSANTVLEKRDLAVLGLQYQLQQIENLGLAEAVYAASCHSAGSKIGVMAFLKRGMSGRMSVMELRKWDQPRDRQNVAMIEDAMNAILRMPFEAYGAIEAQRAVEAADIFFSSISINAEALLQCSVDRRTAAWLEVLMLDCREVNSGRVLGDIQNLVAKHTKRARRLCTNAKAA